MKDLKYLSAYIVPLFCIIGITYRETWLFLTPFIIFIIVPLVELWMPSLKSNLTEEEKESKIKNSFFDVLLWLNVPIIFGTLFYGLYSYSTQSYETYEMIGLVFSLGNLNGKSYG